MADMETRLLFDNLTETSGERIYVTLGPKGHLCSNAELLAMCRRAIADVRSGNGEDVDLSY